MNTEPTYWQRHELVFKNYSLKKIYLEILNIAKSYRQIKDRIEVCYGGLENAGLLIAKMRKPENINKRNVTISLKQNLSTLLRQSANVFVGIIQQTLFFL